MNAENEEAHRLLLQLGTVATDIILDKLHSMQSKYPKEDVWFYYEGLVYENRSAWVKAKLAYQKAYKLSNAEFIADRIVICDRHL